MFMIEWVFRRLIGKELRYYRSGLDEYVSVSLVPPLSFPFLITIKGTYFLCHVILLWHFCLGDHEVPIPSLQAKTKPLILYTVGFEYFVPMINTDNEEWVVVIVSEHVVQKSVKMFCKRIL